VHGNIRDHNEELNLRDEIRNLKRKFELKDDKTKRI